jgi:hypothetical protein
LGIVAVAEGHHDGQAEMALFQEAGFGQYPVGAGPAEAFDGAGIDADQGGGFL